MSATRHILAAPAWPYANGPRHIGHVSGFALPCDMFARYQRMAGHKVLMVSGTDEHGTPILVQADKENATPRETADRYNRVIAEDLVGLDRSSSPGSTGTATSSPGPRWARSPRLPAARCPTATSREPARSAGTTARAVTSATTAATSSTRKT